MFRSYRPVLFYLHIIIAISLLASCTVVKNYPSHTPFVYSNKITLEGDASKDEKKRLQNELGNYWADSLRVPLVTQFLIRNVIQKPFVFDSVHITRSAAYMQAFLNSEGYFNAEFNPMPPDIDTVKDQYRTTVHMVIDLNKRTRIESVTYDSMMPPEIRALAEQNANNSLLDSNRAFSYDIVGAERDRLVNLYRNNGYFKFSRDNIYAEVDTTEAALLEITLDPFEQARRIAEALERRRQNPTIDVAIKTRPSLDSNAFVQHRIGHIYYYPETFLDYLPDSLMDAKFRLEETRREYTLRQNNGIIRFRPLWQHTHIRPGTLYNQTEYFKTVTALTQLGAFSQVDVKTNIRQDSMPVIDFHIFLTPGPKRSFGTDFEVSRNSGSIITGNFLGLANVITLRSYNLWGRSIQSSTNLRNGVELSGLTDDQPVLQTFQTSLSQTYGIPRMLMPRFIMPTRIVKRLDDYKTIVNFSVAYTERKNFFRLRSAVSSFGYDWQRKNHVWLWRPINIELYSLDTLEGLRKAFVENPFLRTAFNTGYITSQNATYTVTFPIKDIGRRSYTSNLRLSGEVAGALLGRIRALNDKIYQYVKGEIEYRGLLQFQKTGLASRFFIGAGYNYGDNPVIGQSLPFFKQFVAGGPNSMRAWPVRQLGLGSSRLSDTSATFRDRFGDFQLEGNLEYRFPLMTIGSVLVNSALFTDVGNIWNLKNNDVLPLTKFRFQRLFTDLAIAAGTGLRFDFSYFLIRLDFAYKVKDPERRTNNGWMSIRDFTWRNKEPNRPLVTNNYAIQLGIGLPF